MKIDSRTSLIGLLGHPVGHSKSPVMMNQAFQAASLPFVYLAFDVPPRELAAAVRGLRALGSRGWNVTIPHKVAIIDYLDELDESARKIGAVNTVVNDDGYLIGKNTDGAGYLQSLREEMKVNLGESRVVILGAGGAARAVAHALVDAGVEELVIANRTVAKGEELAASLGVGSVKAIPLKEVGRWIKEATLLVQTTSVGMEPNREGIPIDPALLHEKLIVSDLVYNPYHTRLLKEAKARGARIHSGLGMLVHQAALAFTHWTGKPAPLEQMWQAARSSFLGSGQD